MGVSEVELTITLPQFPANSERFTIRRPLENVTQFSKAFLLSVRFIAPKKCLLTIDLEVVNVDIQTIIVRRITGTEAFHVPATLLHRHV